MEASGSCDHPTNEEDPETELVGNGGEVINERSFVINNLRIHFEAMPERGANGEVDGFVAIPIRFNEVRKAEKNEECPECKKVFVVVGPKLKLLPK